LSEVERVQLKCSFEMGRLLEMAVEGDSEEMARNELECAKKDFLCDLMLQ
jgi:hypothetical protein